MFNRLIVALLIAVLAGCAQPQPVIAQDAVPDPASSIETTARSALMIDDASGMVLLARNADERLPPASMSKLMTVYLVFEALQQGRLQLDSQLPVSEKAWSMGGSKMFVRVGETISVQDLIHGVIIQSGNDACIVLAEALAGTEAAFADKMNIKAQELGLTNSHFSNSTGWPDPGQVMSARDLVSLAHHLIHDFPEYYPFFGETEFTWEGIHQKNRNPLLDLGLGADGLKTGHTEEAGYGLVGSAVQNGRRVILVITGMGSEALREEEAQRLITWAFREFEDKKLFKGSDVVATAEVWLGTEALVGMTTKGDLGILVPHGSSDKIALHVAYAGPVEAPIEAGQELGTLVVDIPNMGQRTYPLVAANAVPRGGFLTRLNASAHLLGNRILALSGQDGQ